MSWQLLCQCLSPHVWLRGYFSNWIQNKKFVVLAVYILLLSCLSQTKHFQILPSLVNRTLLSIVSLETFQSGWFHECIYAPAETTKLSFNQPHSVCSTRQRLRSQHRRKHYASCLNQWQYQVWTFPLLCQKFPFKRRSLNENERYNILSAILLLPEFHCSRKLISMVSRSRPLPASRPVSHVIKTHYFLGVHNEYNVEERTVLFRFSTFFINNDRLHQIVWQGAITTT